MPALSISSVRSPALCTAGVAARSRSATLARVAILAGATLVALTVRVASLETYGFSEDEVNKLEATEQYRIGRFGANAEHPLLMKLALWGSVEAADAWNRIARVNAAPPAFPEETYDYGAREAVAAVAAS